MNIEALTEAHLLSADAVFVSAMIVQKESFNEVVRMCNRLGKPVIAGGPYPTHCHGEITGVSHFVLGEAEEILPVFLDDLRKGTARAVYQAPERPDISQAPIPRFDLLDMNAYGSMAIQFSRGCPFKCEFCDIWVLYGNKPRLKAPQRVIAEFARLAELGWQGSVFVVDDNFIGNKRRVKQDLLPAIIAWQQDHGYVFRFFTEASINLAEDEKLMALMRDSGFNGVFVGIESPSPESLQETGKNQNLQVNLGQAVRKIQRYGLEVMAGFIVGFDSDSEDIFDRQIRFIDQAGIPQAMVGLLTALPGTLLHQRLAAEGRILGDASGNNTHHLETNFQTKMPAEQLRKGYQKILDTLYDAALKNYFQRCNRLLDNIGEAPLFRRSVRGAEIVMLLKSLFLQPLSPYGFQYVKYLIRNLMKNRRFFTEVVRLGIIGHHFHTMTRELLKVEQISRVLEMTYRNLSDQLRTYPLHVYDASRTTLAGVTDLWRQSQTALKDLSIRINDIHEDFRGEAIRMHAEFARRVLDLFQPLTPILIQSGVPVPFTESAAKQ